ncbi:MAG: adenosylcobinamide-GDP ribazoletransferase [Odoribacter sp.]|nr:adenosylcobinamide-GDP ribazoletransferase [Odoribacter sp.]
MKNIAAAFMFFTRLPLWKIKAFNLPASYYEQAINYWSVTGWLTGGLMAGVLWCAAWVFPYSVAIILAMISRLLLTGALHEDGLADFLDSFGGGTTKEKTLAIMKDSHIGTYGVIGLILYFFLFYSLLQSLPLELSCFLILMADPFCKFISNHMTFFLPYARAAGESKNKVIYRKISIKPYLISAVFGLLPLLAITIYDNYFGILLALLFPIITFFILIVMMKKKIEGYTGDCCGAMFLLCELSFYLGIVLLYQFKFEQIFNM